MRRRRRRRRRKRRRMRRRRRRRRRRGRRRRRTCQATVNDRMAHQMNSLFLIHHFKQSVREE